jgi:uncharacterized protein (DUF488 family)
LGAASPNTAWENAAFRAYADYMMADEFWDALDALLRKASEQNTVIMCSETVWWRCHRRLIADAALARGARVTHILKPNSVQIHRLSPPALIEGRKVVYSAAHSNSKSEG